VAGGHLANAIALVGSQFKWRWLGLASFGGALLLNRLLRALPPGVKRCGPSVSPRRWSAICLIIFAHRDSLISNSLSIRLRPNTDWVIFDDLWSLTMGFLAPPARHPR